MGATASYAGTAGSNKGYLALPATGTGPAVVVLPDRSLGGHITTVVDRFAAEGFVAFAPDLRHGVTGDGGRVGVTGDDRRHGVTGDGSDHDEPDIDPAALAHDLVAVVDHLARRAEVTGPVACVGFCLAGSLALWSATLSDRIVAAVAFYPSLPWARLHPEWSHYAGKAAVIHCSEADGTSQAPDIQAARRAIEEAGGECTLYDYPGTQHAFFNDDRPEAYDGDAATAAWARTLELLRRRLR
ncbi:MAG TPA: dienelactone hydrolase family protein [Micromonosporaceae bacterium]